MSDKKDEQEPQEESKVRDVMTEFGATAREGLGIGLGVLSALALVNGAKKIVGNIAGKKNSDEEEMDI